MLEFQKDLSDNQSILFNGAKSTGNLNLDGTKLSNLSKTDITAIRLTNKTSFSEIIPDRFMENKSKNIKSLQQILSKREAKHKILDLRRDRKNQNLGDSDGFDIFKEQTTLNMDDLMNFSRINKITKTDPWKIDVASSIRQFKHMEFQNTEKKFRIGGRILQSTSKIVRAKSSLVLKESRETQDQLQIDEIAVDEDYDPLDFDNNDGLVDLIDSYDSDDSTNFINEANDDSDFGNWNGISSIDVESLEDIDYASIEGVNIKEYLLEKQQMLKESSINMLYKEDNSGFRYLHAPIRTVYKKINFNDLGKALIQTMKRNLNVSDICKKNKKVDRDLVNKILPENILLKAEEKRALIEDQIAHMFNKIKNRYDGKAPLNFIHLLISRDRRGIVQTLLYLLHLVNRKKIEIWQQILDSEDDVHNEGDEFGSNNDICKVNIYVSPISP